MNSPGPVDADLTALRYPGDSNGPGGSNVLDFGTPNDKCNGGSFIMYNK
jgi:hypothetical protein